MWLRECTWENKKEEKWSDLLLGLLSSMVSAWPFYVNLGTVCTFWVLVTHGCQKKASDPLKLKWKQCVIFDWMLNQTRVLCSAATIHNHELFLQPPLPTFWRRVLKYNSSSWPRIHWGSQDVLNLMVIFLSQHPGLLVHSCKPPFPSMSVCLVFLRLVLFPIYSGMTLNSWYSWLHHPSSGNAEMCHHTWLCFFNLPTPLLFQCLFLGTVTKNVCLPRKGSGNRPNNSSIKMQLDEPMVLRDTYGTWRWVISRNWSDPKTSSEIFSSQMMTSLNLHHRVPFSINVLLICCSISWDQVPLRESRALTRILREDLVTFPFLLLLEIQ